MRRFGVWGAAAVPVFACFACNSALDEDPIVDHPVEVSPNDGGSPADGSSASSTTSASSAGSIAAPDGSGPDEIDAADATVGDAGAADATNGAASDGQGAAIEASLPQGDAGCAPAAAQCVFNAVQTCSGGSWGAPVPCPASTPSCVAGVCVQPPSCQVSGVGTAQCGAGGSGESCCASPLVPGGTFYRSYDIAADGGVLVGANGAPGNVAYPATVSAFRLDKYLVTVARFRQWIHYLGYDIDDAGVRALSGALPAAGSGKHAHLNGGLGLGQAGMLADGGLLYESGWSSTFWVSTVGGNDALVSSCGTSTYTPQPSQNDNLPVSCVSWTEAYAFCIWDGGFLPSDAEWGYAAAGGSAQREFPWGRPIRALAISTRSTARRTSVIIPRRAPPLPQTCSTPVPPPGRRRSAARRWAPGSGASLTWRASWPNGRSTIRGAPSSIRRSPRAQIARP